MQLFILDQNPERAAEMLCDSHLRKMCLETAQILSSVLYRQGRAVPSELPKPYNPNHPVIRAIDTPEKIYWVIRYNMSLHREYFRRFGKTHAYYSFCRKYRKLFSCIPLILRKEDLTFARDFKDFSIEESELVLAYRSYYRYKKTKLRSWHYTKTPEPDWLLIKPQNPDNTGE